MHSGLVSYSPQGHKKRDRHNLATKQSNANALIEINQLWGVSLDIKMLVIILIA